MSTFCINFFTPVFWEEGFSPQPPLHTLLIFCKVEITLQSKIINEIMFDKYWLFKKEKLIDVCKNTRFSRDWERRVRIFVLSCALLKPC